MAVELTWLGHASWLIESGPTTILLDPFLTDSPTSPVEPGDLSPQYILVSHGHADHMADVEEIAKASGATVIAIFELAEWFGRLGIENRVAMNIGGTSTHEFGSVKMVRAEHSSSLPDGTYAGCPAGFVVTIGGKTIYFACDTGLFSDMKLIGEPGLDLAVVPIGDLFTMGPAESLTAIEWTNPKQVLPAHYNTWPPIEQDAEAWAERVRATTASEPIVLEPGGKHVLDS